MTHVLRAALFFVVLTPWSAAAALQAGETAAPAQGPVQPTPAPQTPAVQTPPPPTAGAPTAGAPPPATAAVCPAPVPPATAPSRAFTAQAGLLLHPVQSTRVADFERFLLYVRDALARTTSPTLRNQARGWRFFRVTEAGPNGDVIYAFLLDPAVPCVDYALAPILAEAYPDPAQLQEIWKLYTTSVRSGGTIMNLTALPAAPPPPVITPPTVQPGTTKGPTLPTTTPGQTPSGGGATTPAPPAGGSTTPQTPAPTPQTPRP